MLRRTLTLILALGFLLVGPLLGQADPSTTTPSNPGLHLLRSDESGVVLEFSTPAYALTPAGAYQRLTVPGAGLTAKPGRPQVPVVGTLLGIPPSAWVELRLLADDAVTLPGRYTLSPAPHPAPLADDLQPGELIHEPDAAAYASDAPHPPAPARIADDAWLRDQRVVRVELYPFQYNPARGTLLWHRRLQVEVQFHRPSSFRKLTEDTEAFPCTSAPSLPCTAFEPVLRRALLNYETAKAWRGRPTPHTATRNHSPVGDTQFAIRNSQSASPRYKIIVDHDAIYRLTYADLQAAGVDVDAVDPRAFGLTSQGQDVAIYVAGEDDGRFDPDDFVVFYGQKYRGTLHADRYADQMAHWLTLCPRCRLAGMLEKYTDENVYWLTVGDAPGPRMATTDGRPTDTAPVPASYWATVHAEESHEWYTHHFAGEDTWFWERIQPGPADATRTYTITLTALATGPFTATIRAAIASRSTNPGHHTQFYFNGYSQPLDDAIWDGKSGYAFEAQVPQFQLLRRANRLYLPLIAANTQSTRSLSGTWPETSRKIHHAFDARLPQSQAPESAVQLDFVILFNGAFEDMYFDWFEIQYARRFQAADDQLLFPGEEGGTWQYEIEGFTDPDVRVYDVTDPLTPKRVLNPRASPLAAKTSEVSPGPLARARTGGTSEVYPLAFEASHEAGVRYLAVAAPAVRSPHSITPYVPPDPRSPTNGADYVIVTHRQFYDAVQPLADHRASQGLRVTVVDVDDLYNEFNDGVFNPIAIRNFLAYAYANWQPPAPSYVLLVGDGHWNFKGYGVERYGPPEPIYVPPNLAWVDPWQGEVDSTNLLAAVVGDDILPDLHIGRLPVNTVEELDAAITKIIAYEQAGPQDWQRHILFVADNVPDEAGDFVSLADDIIANHLPSSLQADRIYLNDYCGAPANPPQPCPAVNAAIVETLNQTGALLVNYIGHASVDRWADEQVFVKGDIPSLANGDRLPVVLSMTCLDGYFYYPNRPSLAEELVRAADRGAVATFSPTGLGIATGHHVLQRRFYDAVFSETSQDGVRELGPATLAAKLALYASGRNYDLIHTFTVFGDPALRLGWPPSKVYLPIIGKGPGEP